MRLVVPFLPLFVTKAEPSSSLNASSWNLCQDDLGLQGADGCGRCLQKKIGLDHVCSFCPADNQCYALGSSESPCSSDQCISLSQQSQCSKTDMHNCPASIVVPGGIWDYNPWDENCYMSHYQGACGVDGSSTRNHLPTVEEDAVFEITFRRTVFALHNEPPWNVHAAYHSGILVQQHGSVNAFHIELVALHFDQSIIVPDANLTWHNDAALEWMPALSRSYDDYWDSWIRLGSAKGHIVNKWLTKALDFISDRPKYKFLGVWSDPDLRSAEVHLEDSICHSFSEWSLQTLSNEGADFSAVVQPVCRNYMTFITDTPTAVDIHDADVDGDAKVFYEKLLACFAGMTLDEASSLAICHAQLQDEGEVYYVGADLESYYVAATVEPGFNRFGGEEYVEQRMRLPWQDWKTDARVGECAFPESRTSVTADLNSRIQRRTDLAKVFSGGPGVLLRPLMDGNEDGDSKVVPAHFWHNDAHAPNQLRPQSGGGGGSPFCPNDGGDGFGEMGSCDADKFGELGPWNYAQLAAVVGTAMPSIIPSYDHIQDEDWGDWVFYPFQADSNDLRCKRSGSGYDCPGAFLPDGGEVRWDPERGGAGSYEPGSAGGGGAGCHWESYGPGIDQTDAVGDDGNGLVQDYDCQCNYAFRNDGWESWVDTWVQHAVPKQGFEWMGWFGSGLAPTWGMSIASCWVNNPRDMIYLQNAIYRKRLEWNNQLAPKTNWEASDTPKDLESLRSYWGWNEVPVGRSAISDPMHWDAIVIKLPAAACDSIGTNDDSVACLKSGAQTQLAHDLHAYVAKGYLVPGKGNIGSRPGSYVVFAREFMDINGHFTKEFFCEPWTAPNGQYRIVFDRMTKGGNDWGACYIEHGSGQVSV